MYKDVSNEFITVHSATGRTFHTLLYNGNAEKIPSEVIKLKISSGNSSCEDISIGNVFSSVVTVEIQYSDDIAQSFINGKKVMLYVDLELSDSSSEAVPVNTDFKVISSVRNGEKLSVTLADKLYDSDVLFTCVTSSPTAEDIVQEICNDLGISGYDSDGCSLASLKISAIPENVTCRRMLGYIASYFGKNVYIGRDGKLLFRWYDFSATLELDDDVISPPEIGENVTIEAVACAVDGETVLTSGSGRALTFENPYMTQTQLNAIKASLCVSYNIASIKHLVGSALVDAWDTVSYNGCVIPVMGCDVDFDGGVTTVYTSAGKTAEEAAAKRIASTEVLIEQAKKYADDAAKKATELLSGAKGGYYIEKTDENGQPYETLWMDADTESSAKHCICINKNGIGFGEKDSNNKWVFKQAWTIDGTLVTDYITANELSITGKLTNKKTGTADDTEMDMNFEVSAELNIPILNKTFNAAGIRAWSDKEDSTNEALYTNWGLFFNSSNEDDTLKTLLTSILASANGLNFYGVRGFYLEGEADENGNIPHLGAMLNAGFWSNNAFKSEDGFYVNDDPCLTNRTGFQAIIESRISDCNSPTANEDEASVDSFGGSTLNSPFPGSVGYIVSFCARTSGGFYFVQFGIRYRDYQIKMRVKNKYNPNSDGTTAAWSDWVSTAEAAYDSDSAQGYETHLSGRITQWGTVTASSSGTAVTFEKEYTNKNYGISLTVMGGNRNVWYSNPTTTGFKIWASADDTPVNWMTVGI